jgi:hypothetical protein
MRLPPFDGRKVLGPEKGDEAAPIALTIRLVSARTSVEDRRSRWETFRWLNG